MNPSEEPTVTDPVIAKREKIRRFCEIGSQIGYTCFAVATVMFVVAFIIDFPTWSVTVILAAMLVGSIVLPPAIVLGYGVKAADADDKGEKFGY